MPEGVEHKTIQGNAYAYNQWESLGCRKALSTIPATGTTSGRVRCGNRLDVDRR